MKPLAFLLLIGTSVSSAQNVSDLLPISIGSYTTSDSARIYAGDELYRMIDGGADIFREYGFGKVIVQRYSDKTEDQVDVELYEMEDSSSAYGIFSLITYNTGRRVDGFPCEAYAGDGFLLFWKGKYYCSLTSSDRSNDSGFARVAEAIAGRIAGSGKPELVNMFNRYAWAYRSESRIVYIKGNLGLYNLNAVPFEVDLRFAEGVSLSAAGVGNVVFSFATREACEKGCSLIVKRLNSSADWDTLYTGQDGGLFRKQKKYLGIFHVGCRLVVSTSEIKAGVESMSAEIRQILEDERVGSE